VGVVWAGNPAFQNDLNRSVPLEQLMPLLACGAKIVSLQKDLRTNDWQFLAAHPEILHLGAELNDFSDTAAVVAALDLVVSVDTAVAHLTGALGRPLFLLLPWVPDWRWMLNRDDSPWYPSARLFRQSGPGEWRGTISRAVEALLRTTA
jgi:hypothetical protein